MEASGRSSCPACGSAHVQWSVERSGRRGQPLTGRSLVWRCGSCEARFLAPAGDPAADASPAVDGLSA